MTDYLPVIRHSERVDFKRCQKKWYWNWRVGLATKQEVFGALTLGTWMHLALAGRYAPNYDDTSLEAWFDHITSMVLKHAADLGEVPDYLMEKGHEQRALGLAMAAAYDKRYGSDPGINVLDVEVPLEFEIRDSHGKLIAKHKLKPDMIYTDADGGVWLMEHKTAKQIRLGHLVIDDQARPYAAMAEIALRRAGLITPDQQFRGVMYNFLRKALPDERPTNEKGQCLNKNGTVSKSQPSPIFVRYPVTLTRRGKTIALARLQNEAVQITEYTRAIRSKRLHPDHLMKTPHSSCEKLCQYFTMCVVEEQGGNITEMRKNLYVKRDPYLYDEDSADIPISFELS